MRPRSHSVFNLFVCVSTADILQNVHLPLLFLPHQLPDVVTQLAVLYHMIESRVKMFHKLSKLHGKLHLLMTQVGVFVDREHSNMASSTVAVVRINGVLIE